HTTKKAMSGPTIWKSGAAKATAPCWNGRIPSPRPMRKIRISRRPIKPASVGGAPIASAWRCRNRERKGAGAAASPETTRAGTYPPFHPAPAHGSKAFRMRSERIWARNALGRNRRQSIMCGRRAGQRRPHLVAPGEVPPFVGMAGKTFFHHQPVQQAAIASRFLVGEGKIIGVQILEAAAMGQRRDVVEQRAHP